MKVAVIGYGHVGKWTVNKIENTPDLEVSGIVSRRAKKLSKELDYEVAPDIDGLDADVGILATETEHLFEATPKILECCDSVDSFDMHHRTQKYFELIDKAAKKNNRVALYAHGWDPGLFSEMRVIFEAFFPRGETLYEYGINLPSGGVSRGHSAELNREFSDRIELAVSRTFPKNEESQNVREVTIAKRGDVDEGELIEDVMRHPYFRGDDVSFKFKPLNQVKEYFTEEHSGQVIRRGETRDDIREEGKFELILYSNPGFTAQVLVSSVHAIPRMRETFGPGAYNMTQVPPNYYSPKTNEEIREEFV
ncbi:hypothetical protein AKJ35_01330 [candidate division MSBL1 archaeon SCGC-AAA833F18]|uniref:Meso-diaminopimelate D-dehydrogenase n=2 Tax=candidate division MSBL1 TaxID=215777 RepID=A0A133VSZ7_9EURY|nr:hypothetical protein AKJ35_01330 [candidate division MSBL1 archaeon SCGC-AAA833F18]KXB09589.1 hypothetical protein AKJ46_00130 [candidate division MSBL1 archaeon SCGC-AAA833K04]